MNTKRLIIFFIIILASTHIAIAAQSLNNLEINYKTLTKEGCLCSYPESKFEIINKGNSKEVYTLSADKGVNGKGNVIEFSQKEVTLDSNKSANVSARIKLPCDVSSETYNANISVKTKFSKLAAILPLNFKLKPCLAYEVRTGKEYNLRNLEPKDVIKFENHTNIYSLCELSSIGIPLLVINKEGTPNTYLFSLDGERWSSLAYNKVKLNPYEYTVNNLRLNTPDIKGEYKLQLNIEKEKEKARQNITIKVNVDYCYKPNISIEKALEVNHSEDTNKIKIINLGKDKADYNLSVEPKREWIKLDPSSFLINGKEIKPLNVIILYNSTRKGDYAFKLRVKVNETGALYVFPFRIKIAKESGFDKLYGKVKQYGNKGINYAKSTILMYKLYFMYGLALLVSAILLFSFIKYLLRKDKENRFIKKEWDKLIGNRIVEFSFEKGKLAVYKVSFTLKREVSNAAISLESYYRKPIKIKTPSGIVYQYFNVIRTHLGDRNLRKVMIYFSVRKGWLFNNGIKKGEIVLQRFYDYHWQKFKCEIDDEDENYVYYKARTPGFSYFAITPEREIPIVQVEKKVQGITKEEIKTEKKRVFAYIALFLSVLLLILLLYYQFYGYPPILKEISGSLNFIFNSIKGFVLVYKWFLLAGAILLFAIIIIIKASKEKEIEKEKKKVTKPTRIRHFITFLVMAMILIAAYFSYTLYSNKPIGEVKKIISQISLRFNEIITTSQINRNITANISVGEVIKKEEKKEEAVIKGIPPQIWKEDTVHVINLSAYFNDPDNDELFFSSSTPQNIEVDIDQGSVILKPRKDWFGNDSIIFRADDLKGGIAESNNVTLVVENVPEQLIPSSLSNILSYRKAMDFISLYKFYIISGFVMLTIFLVIARYHEPILDFLEERDTKKKRQRKNKKS